MYTLLLLALLVCTSLNADPLNSGIQYGTSVSHSHQSRNVLTNPAALAYYSELNDVGLMSSYLFGYSHDKREQRAATLSYGPLGIGYEKILSGTADYSRFSLAASVPFSDQFFLGTRFSFTASDTAALSGVHSLDFGGQYRPFSFLSFGAMINRSNRPKVGGTRLSPQWVFSATVRPIEKVDLSFDIDTLNENFGKTWGYQGIAKVEPLTGFFAYAGYHKDYKAQFGIQVDLGRASVFGFGQPHSAAGGSNSQVTFGFETSVLTKRSAIEPKVALEVEIDPSMGEQGARGTLFAKERTSLVEILERIESAKDDPSVSAVIVKVGSFPLGLGAAQEIHEALWKVREAGKTVEAYLGSANATEYLIASAASKIHMDPTGEIRILGPRSERMYARGTFDKLGVEGQFLARGEYKSAPEMFTRKDASPSSREATNHELAQLEEEYVKLLTRSRKLGTADYQKIVRHAIFSAQEAIDFRLIDSVDNYVQEKEKKEKQYAMRSSLTRESSRLNLPSRIAVITAQGNILDRKVRLLSVVGEDQITPDRMERLLDKALGDKRTKAIVLRVTSPGGEVLASHRVATMIENAKSKKPVIVSMGDVAASGGYMISAPADHIFANPLTATGSIGVFLGKFSLENLYKKIDLHKEIFSKYPYAGIFSESRPWNADERKVMQRQLDNYYEGFVSFVARHRHLKKEDAELAARGRVWLGNDALSRKLIDRTGGVLDAVRFAKEKLGLDEKETETWVLVENPGFFSFGQDGIMGQSSALESLSGVFFTPEMVKEMQWMASLKEQPFLYWSSVNLSH